PDLQRLRRDRPAQLPADEDRLAAEPAGAGRLRPTPGRPDPPDGPARLAAGAQTRHGHHPPPRQLSGPLPLPRPAPPPHPRAGALRARAGSRRGPHSGVSTAAPPTRAGGPALPRPPPSPRARPQPHPRQSPRPPSGGGPRASPPSPFLVKRGWRMPPPPASTS